MSGIGLQPSQQLCEREENSAHPLPAFVANECGMSPYGSDPNTYQGDYGPNFPNPNFNEIYGEPSARPTTNSLPCLE